ncbi:hypothetical protein BaRGS_00009458 [Batillaria attramentaria]|uniref:Ribonuclease H2 subunit B n=1 Tax=Batillaria attramentaria TaxID=370345 RepID=A0ABD0LJ72_9CAEN
MPRLPSRQNSTAKIVTNDPPQKQWIMVAEESILEGDHINEEDNVCFCKLRHPKSENTAMYVISNGGQLVSEVNRFSPDFGSWLIGNSIQKDGGILMTTPVDPVFLVLPYLINASKGGKFMTLDQIVHDGDFPDCVRLLRCSGIDCLDQVTDIKGADDFKAYRYNKDKTLAWLRLKAENVVEALQNKDVRVSESGAHSSDFVRSKKDQTDDQDAYLKYACGMVSDYLPLDIATELRDHLGIKETDASERSAEEPPSKKAKISDSTDITPTEDYSSANGKDLKRQNSKGGKQTAAQKKLSKVDKSGMKSLSSFFSPKAKS